MTTVGEEATQDFAQSPFTYHVTPDALPHSDPINVILFGETGVGKSSVINLMVGRDVAKTSDSLEGCTQEATKHCFSLSGDMSLCVYDTVGLEESAMDFDAFINPIEKVQELIRSLKQTGTVDLLVFCVKAGRFTASMQRNYHLFSEILCDNRVPLALIITHLENEDVMENWWERNKKTFEKYGINTVAHACITAAHVTLYVEKRTGSQRALQKLFLDAFSDHKPPSYVQVIRNSLCTFTERHLYFLTSRKKRRQVTKKLEKHCALPRDEAQRLAKLIVKR